MVRYSESYFLIFFEKCKLSVKLKIKLKLIHNFKFNFLKNRSIE